jgi:hypothetical protein
MIGGSSRIINRLLKWFDMLSIVSPIDSVLSARPAIIPRIVVKPASCKYLCFDLFRKCPDEIAITSRNTMHRISVEMII